MMSALDLDHRENGQKYYNIKPLIIKIIKVYFVVQYIIIAVLYSGMGHVCSNVWGFSYKRPQFRKRGLPSSTLEGGSVNII
jgi:hypothetical protein